MDEPITALCPECGVIIEIKDIRAFLLALHLNYCTATDQITPRG